MSVKFDHIVARKANHSAENDYTKHLNGTAERSNLETIFRHVQVVNMWWIEVITGFRRKAALIWFHENILYTLKLW